MITYVVTNDWQIPFHNTRIIDGLFMPFLKWLKPSGFIWNGDIIDNYTLSEFSHDPLSQTDLLNEVAITQDYMDQISHVKSLQTKIWLGGNHEDRVRRKIWKCLPDLQLDHKKVFEDLFKPEQYGFEYYPYGAAVALGKLDVTHGYIVRQNSAYSGKAHFDRRGGSVLVGHTHRLGIYYKTNTKGTHAAFENGCMCSLEPEWCQDPDWQHGFSVVHVGDKGFFHVQQIPIIDNSIMFYGNKIWEV